MKIYTSSKNTIGLQVQCYYLLNYYLIDQETAEKIVLLIFTQQIILKTAKAKQISPYKVCIKRKQNSEIEQPQLDNNNQLLDSGIINSNNDNNANPFDIVHNQNERVDNDNKDSNGKL